MRRSVASFALIRKQRDGHVSWLSQWNRNWDRFNFVGGHKHPEESFRECVIRELSEELGLAQDTEFVVAQQPACRLNYNTWSKSALSNTDYTVELFQVNLVGDQVRRKVAANAMNRWLLEREIRTGRCADGKLISDTMKMFMEEAGLWTDAPVSTNICVKQSDGKANDE